MSWLIQPSLSTEIPVYRDPQSGGVYHIMLTIGQILSKLASQNLGDSFAIIGVENGGGSRLGLTIRPFYRKNTSNNLYIATKDYLNVSVSGYTDYLGLGDNIIPVGGRNTSYEYNDSSELFTSHGGYEWPTKIVNDVNYCYLRCHDHENPAQIDLQGFYVSGEIDKIFIDNVEHNYHTFSNGGGATHIAKENGLLSSLSSDLSKVLIVSGGGGGGLVIDNGTRTAVHGADAGGIAGNGSNSGDQSTGHAFGAGQSGSTGSGGGAGYYGGFIGTSEIGGGAGSGYIANANLSNKYMYGHNVTVSTVISTKTFSGSSYSEVYRADTPKMGDGHVRIRLKKELPEGLDGDLSLVGTYHVGTANHGGSIMTIPVSGNGNQSQWHTPLSMFCRDNDLASDYMTCIQGFNPNCTVSISTANDTINVTYTGFTAVRKFYAVGYDRARVSLNWEQSPAPANTYRMTFESGRDEEYLPTRNNFLTLVEALNYVYHKFRNINLVVDGETWVAANFT